MFRLISVIILGIVAIAIASFSVLFMFNPEDVSNYFTKDNVHLEVQFTEIGFIENDEKRVKKYNSGDYIDFTIDIEKDSIELNFPKFDILNAKTEIVSKNKFNKNVVYLLKDKDQVYYLTIAQGIGVHFTYTSLSYSIYIIGHVK